MAETHPLRQVDESIVGDHVYQEWNQKAEELAKTCESIEMPCLRHLKLADYNLVYEPSEDTYLLLDGLGVALQQNKITKQAKKMNVLEIGCGTGVGIIYLTKQLLLSSSSSDEVECYVTDINPDAIRIMLATAEANHIPSSCIHAHQCDLATLLLPLQTAKMDVILFNPPYVPTPDDEVGSSTAIEASWAGGTDGRIVLDRAFPQIKQLLSYPHGVAFIIVVDDNKPYQIHQLLQQQYSLHVQPLLRRKERNEFLTLLQITHCTITTTTTK